MSNINILVTGSARGLGLEISRDLLNCGANVYGLGRTLSEEYKNLMKEFPNNAYFQSFDLVDTENIKDQIFTKYISNSVPIHGFVNNAAIAYDDIITNINLDKLEYMFKVNVFSPFILTKYVIRNMIFNRIQGSIVHLSSISAHTGYKGLSMYASTKGALEAFSKNTAREWGEKGIRSNTLVAGFMETDMSGTLTDEYRDRIYKRTSLKKPTSTKSVSSTISFLLSANSGSITGQNIHVDSGTI